MKTNSQLLIWLPAFKGSSFVEGAVYWNSSKMSWMKPLRILRMGPTNCDVQGITPHGVIQDSFSSELGTLHGG